MTVEREWPENSALFLFVSAHYVETFKCGLTTINRFLVSVVQR